MALLVAIITFVTALCVVLGVWILAGGGTAPQDVIRQRLDAVRMAERRGGGSTQQLKIVRDEMLSTVPFLNRMMLQWSWTSRLRQFIYQAGLTARPAKVLLFSGVLGLATYIFLGYLFGNAFISGIAGILVAAAPLSVIALMRQRRMRSFEEGFPEALDLLGRAVRAGHAFTTGLELIASECREPISSEFRTTFEEQNLGLPIRDSLLNLTERMPLVDVRLFVTALLIQKETGGNLAEILDELSRVIRERFKIYREVNIKTAQGKLTAVILIAMPMIMMAVLGVINPSYLKILFDDPVGRMMLMAAGGLQLFGSLLLWKIVHIEV
jgi:tight adherence protein B